MDLTGWRIELASSSWMECWSFDEIIVPAGGYLLVGAGSETQWGAFEPTLRHGGAETDGIRLVDPDGRVVVLPCCQTSGSAC